MHTVAFPVANPRPALNFIRTTNYTLLTFLPLNLLHQFSRVYNLYFLCGALSVLFGFSSLSPMSQIAPLMIILAFSAAKDAIEDYGRHRADTLANQQLVSVKRGGVVQEVKSEDINAGDIIILRKGEKFPVDVLLTESSSPDGTVYIATAELDGETNLKAHSCLPLSDDLAGRIECDLPNANLYSFNGRVVLQSESKHIPVSMENVALRGCVLRNTTMASGIVVYVGNDTKIMKNMNKGKLKTSSLERQLNYLVGSAFIFNAVLLVTSVFLQNQFYTTVSLQEQDIKNAGAEYYASHWYFGYMARSANESILGTSIGFFTLYTYVIPSTLFVTIELVRLGQAFFMHRDLQMKTVRQNSNGSVTEIDMVVNNSNLNEDLGKIDIIFSDKTGTLTQNCMSVVEWFVDESLLNEKSTPGVILDEIRKCPGRMKLQYFLEALSICHGVIPAVEAQDGKIIYESQSPDETALLNAAADNGYKLITRNHNSITIEIQEMQQTHDILSILEFNSDRKRMSVIVRLENKIVMYCKGADNVMIPRLANPATTDIHDSLTQFSKSGLRTLVLARKELSLQDFEEFQDAYESAKCSLEDREATMEKVANKFENGFEFLGVSAIEDQLQDEVPATIASLLAADIKIWLLTGDKQETAINIGISSNLIESDMQLIILSGTNEAECTNSMELAHQRMDQTEGGSFALVVDGTVLDLILAKSSKLSRTFLDIGIKCKTVICCRVTPLQKSLVVRLVRRRLSAAITLAIGDGSNDLAMIQEAHVGVGIVGREGTQAARAADYAIGEFQLLSRLILVHGRYSYLQMSGMILYSFYKNFVFIFIQFIFGFYSAWSAQTVYEEIFFIGFNLFFTAIPPMFYGMMERDFDPAVVLKNPQLYIHIKKGHYWNYGRIIYWFLLSIAHACVIFFTILAVTGEGVIDYEGRSTGYWVQCYLFSTPMLYVILLKHALISRLWTWVITIGLASGLVTNLAFMVIISYGYFSSSEFLMAPLLHGMPSFYLLCVLLPALCILPDLFLNYMYSLFHPSDSDLMMESDTTTTTDRIERL